MGTNLDDCRFTANKETEVFRAEFGEEFPDLVDLAASVSSSLVIS